MYSIYYHIPSRFKFRSVDKSPMVDDLSELVSLTALLKWGKDSVFAYDHEKLNKLSISLSKDKSLYCFEVLSSNGVYWRNIELEELSSILLKIKEVISDPEAHGFGAETA